MAQQTANQVLFKYGPESNLLKLTADAASRSGIQPGAFYITSDTNRMYLGVDKGGIIGKDIVALNEGIITVTALEDLPNVNDLTTEEKARLAGQLYYVSGVNILCVFNGKQWVQLNPDTYVDEFTLASTQTAEDSVVTYTGTIGNNIDDSSLSIGWQLTSDNSITLTLTDATNNVVNIASALRLTTKATPTDPSKTAIEKNTATFVLQGRNSEAFSTINIQGDDYIGVTSDAAGNIKVDGSKLHDADIKKINSKIDGDGKWYVQIGLQDDNKVIEPNSKDVTLPFQPKITYGKAHAQTNEKTSAVFVGTGSGNTWGSEGCADLDVYTIGQVDDLITEAKRDLNAMAYKGATPTTSPSLSGNKFYPASVSIGDTWKVASENYTTFGNWYESKDNSKLATGEAWTEVGDLLIANVISGKTEEEDGTIAAANLKWDYIPSGDDVNNIYLHATKTHGFVVSEKAVGEATQVLDVALAEGTDIILTDTKTADNTGISIKIDHAPLETTYSLDDEFNLDADGNYFTDPDNPFTIKHVLSACKGIETTGTGHVKTVYKRDYHFRDTNASMKQVSIGTAETTVNSKPVVKVDTSVQLQHYHQDNIDDIKTGGMYMQSANENIVLNASTVTITESGGQVTVPTVSFNLVWGTF